VSCASARRVFACTFESHYVIVSTCVLLWLLSNLPQTAHVLDASFVNLETFGRVVCMFT
jgi:hypothetical protein